MTHNTPDPVADKALADLAETFIEINTMTPDQAHACRKFAWWLANTTCVQLITLAEAEARVAVESERCAVIAESMAPYTEEAIRKATAATAMASIAEVIQSRFAFKMAAAIRAAATGTR